MFINPVTEVQTRYGFRFDFTKAQESLTYLLPKEFTFYKDPAWQQFIASVDSSRFQKFSIQKPLDLQCNKTAVWSSEMQEHYFGKDSRFRGYYALQADYSNFGAIVSLSNAVYSGDTNKAICYCSKISDSKAGSGNLVFLELKNGHWIIVGSAQLWVA
ncbi:hypothetical protein GCM10028807_27610 [Spirosoma daeguense]